MYIKCGTSRLPPNLHVVHCLQISLNLRKKKISPQITSNKRAIESCFRHLKN